MRLNTLLVCLITLFFQITAFSTDNTLKDGFINGDPGISSINAMSFGPAGILFIGDSEAADIKAIDLSHHNATNNSDVNIKNLDGLISELLGSAKDQVQITDLVANPVNGNIYLSVQHSSGKPILFMVEGEGLTQVPLTQVSYSKISLKDPVGSEAKDRRGRSLRKWSISDIHYADGKVFVSGLSNKEFASTFRAIDFPFNSTQNASSLEIYHAAHGQYETHSPVKTFTTAQINGAPHVVASYTCTPLVIIPLHEMKDGAHSKARTVAELGNRNTPLDIIEMESKGERVLLMANSSRALMKIKIRDIEAFGDSLTTPVEENSATAGVDFINFPLVNIQQLAKLSATEFVIVQRDANGDLILKAEGPRWL